ncbi:MAG: hypothetical protein QM778_24970 [Myxococcales bacterium]
MQNRKLLVGLLCLTANATWLVETAQADRRTSLGGNLLIKDPDDVFPFPQTTVLHRNMIRLDYGGNSGSGNGVLTLGNENHAFGIALHRGDLLSPDIVGFNTELEWLSGVQNPFTAPTTGVFAAPAAAGSNAGPIAPATVFDVMYGKAIGDNAFGLRLGFGRGIQARNVDGETEKAQQTFAALQAGYSILPKQGLRLDLSGNVVVAFANSTGLDAAGDQQDINSGTRVRAGFLARGYIPVNDVVDIGLLGNASFTNEHFKDKTQDPDLKANTFDVGLMGGIGPVINLAIAKIAAYGGFLGAIGKSDPDTKTDNDATKSLNFFVPMVNMAAEVQLLDWLYVRTGTQYSWSIDRVRDTTDNPTKERASTGNFIWTAGLGLAKNNFAFDGVVQNGFVTGGPNFIGGNANGFLAMATLTYKFGDVFSSGTSQVEVAPAEPQPTEPVPSEPVEPAATPEYAPPPPPAPVEGSTGGAINGTTGTTVAPSGGVNVGGSVGTP